MKIMTKKEFMCLLNEDEQKTLKTYLSTSIPGEIEGELKQKRDPDYVIIYSFFIILKDMHMAPEMCISLLLNYRGHTLVDEPEEIAIDIYITEVTLFDDKAEMELTKQKHAVRAQNVQDIHN